MRWPYVLHAPAQAGADVLFGLYGDTPRPAAAQVEWWTEAAGERGAVAVEADYALRNWVGARRASTASAMSGLASVPKR